MAKRKNKLLLSDLFPELAAEREVAEEEEREREEEEPARKKSKRGRPPNEEKWNARLEVCKEWKRTKGRFPKANKKDKEENNLYVWLKEYKHGGRKWTQARWEKLNEAFGEGWEKECFPNLETGGVFQPGHQHNPRDESQWDAILEAAKLFKRTHGRFPRGSGGDADETRLQVAVQVQRQVPAALDPGARQQARPGLWRPLAVRVLPQLHLVLVIGH